MNERYALCFSKFGNLRFISHLDLLRTFQRTVRRAGLPAAYSQGYNPHMLLSFALPLPLGMESIWDYAELYLTEKVEIPSLLECLNNSSPKGLTFINARVMPPEETRFAASTAMAEYWFMLGDASKMMPNEPTVTIPPKEAKHMSMNTNKSNVIVREDASFITVALAQIQSETSIVVPKKTKSGIKDTDIRPDICRLSFEPDLESEPESEPYIGMFLSAGSARFLHPNVMAGIICDRLGVTIPEHARKIKRVQLYREMPTKDFNLKEIPDCFVPLFATVHENP